jgi:hypothetical protein
VTDLPLIDGRQPFILECNSRFCVIYDEIPGPRWFLNAAGEWDRNDNGDTRLYQFKSRAEAEAFVVKCSGREGVRCD